MLQRGVLSLAKPATPATLSNQQMHRLESSPLARTFKTLQHQGYDGDGFFLATPHPKMPNLILTPEQLSDVTAYILSLRENR